MKRLVATLAILTGAAGCQGIQYPLASCDGYSKRPLNRSMWNWEQEKGKAADQANAFLPIPDLPASIQAFAQQAEISADNPDSYKSCS